MIIQCATSGDFCHFCAHGATEVATPNAYLIDETLLLERTSDEHRIANTEYIARRYGSNHRLAPPEHHPAATRRGRARLRRPPAVEEDAGRRPDRRPGRGDARHARVFPDQAPAVGVSRGRDGLQRVCARGQLCGVPADQRFRPSRQRRPGDRPDESGVRALGFGRVCRNVGLDAGD